MKTRMEKFHKDNNESPRREDKNSFLYDEIYVEKKDPTSNITLIDNVNEIDINRIKEMMSSRETYKKSREYSSIIGIEEKKQERISVDLDEPDTKDYDINELIKKKKDGIEEDSEKIRKISNTQYDILKGLSVTSKESDFFTQEKDLSQMMEKITDNEEKTLDLFKDLKGNDEEELTNSSINNRKLDLKPNSNTFEFEKDDFEDLNSNSKDEKSFSKMITLIFLIVIAILIGIFYLVSQYLINSN
ncbi:MAG: hypothetical protein GX032_00470 [Tenericutes bacterium]|nr:hypothetical protein [Bacilli bacterium]MDD4624136.1 hypothetical protein [Bacilli bacterium]MDD4831719.1 hypothetical protein [Bacilli bacterium]NLV89941.1 hypothetical protein [Mycoplasmatota bacterium]